MESLLAMSTLMNSVPLSSGFRKTASLNDSFLLLAKMTVTAGRALVMTAAAAAPTLPVPPMMRMRFPLRRAVRFWFSKVELVLLDEEELQVIKVLGLTTLFLQSW
jgi:hypothetical protein